VKTYADEQREADERKVASVKDWKTVFQQPQSATEFFHGQPRPAGPMTKGADMQDPKVAERVISELAAYVAARGENGDQTALMREPAFRSAVIEAVYDGPAPREFIEQAAIVNELLQEALREGAGIQPDDPDGVVTDINSETGKRLAGDLAKDIGRGMTISASNPLAFDAAREAKGRARTLLAKARRILSEITQRGTTSRGSASSRLDDLSARADQLR